MKKMKILFILLFSVNVYASAVATITALSGSANIQRGSKVITASLGDKLNEKDNIITKNDTVIQIIFKDNTIISIGKNSKFSIKEYYFGGNQEPVAKFGMLKGAMRAITGRIGKISPHKFSVETKTATIGIRGTNFSVVVHDDGSYQAYCSFGEIFVNVDSQKHTVDKGSFFSITPNGNVQVKEFTKADLIKMRAENFATAPTTSSSLQPTNNISEDGENNEQLNLTVTDESGTVTQGVADLSLNAIQEDSFANDLSLVTDNSVIAGYSMNNASYSGTYTTTSNTTSTFTDTGTASLSVDFGADTASLVLTTSAASPYSVTYDQNAPGPNSSSFSMTMVPSAFDSGTADATFYGDGSLVKGNFSFKPISTVEAIGTYEVSTSQALQ